jgi:hypothetical protein
MNNLQPIDIVDRVCRNYPVWEERPIYKLFGAVGSFGKLVIETSVWRLEWSIFIQNRQHIMECCLTAIDNCGRIYNQHWN